MQFTTILELGYIGDFNVPAVSKKQQIAMAIAEHEPEKLHAENKGMLDMTHKQLHDFASTSRSHLPTYAHARKARKEQGH